MAHCSVVEQNSQAWSSQGLVRGTASFQPHRLFNAGICILFPFLIDLNTLLGPSNKVPFGKSGAREWKFNCDPSEMVTKFYEL